MIWLLVIPALALGAVVAYGAWTLLAAVVHHGRHELREQAGEAEAKAFVAELRGEPAPGETIYTDRSVRLPRTPQLWTPSRQPTEAELDEWRERFLAAQGRDYPAVLSPAGEDDSINDFCAGCWDDSQHCDGADGYCVCPCTWEEDWAEEHDEPASQPEDSPAQVPHAAPDTPRTCGCGLHEGHLAERLLSCDLDDVDAAFATGQFAAVTGA